MRFLRGRSKPLPAPPTETRTEDALSLNSSDALSVLLHDIEASGQDLQILERRENVAELNEEILLKQGKVHKSRILSHWVACQTYLSQAEVDARARQSAFRMQVNGEDQFMSAASEDSNSGSVLTSRSTTSTTLGRFSSQNSGALFSSRNSGHFMGRLKSQSSRAKGSSHRNELQGFRYESYTQSPGLVTFIHDDSARVEEDWAKLHTTWRESLHIAGPKPKADRPKKVR